MKVTKGDKAPSFKLMASNGQEVSLADYLKKSHIVLYFYPKDDTPGCTVEACGFRDKISALEKLGATVLGVSPDGLSRHQKFIEKFGLPFLLLCDVDKKLCQDYGVWVKKSMYGREYFGVARTTFIIDRSGSIAHVFEKVNPKEHELEVLEVLKALD